MLCCWVCLRSSSGPRRDRIVAGLDRARALGRLVRPRTRRSRSALDEGRGVRETARLLKVSPANVSEVRRAPVHKVAELIAHLMSLRTTAAAFARRSRRLCYNYPRSMQHGHPVPCLSARCGAAVTGDTREAESQTSAKRCGVGSST